MLAAFRENLQGCKDALHDCARKEDWEGVAICARGVRFWRQRLTALVGFTRVEVEGVVYVATIETKEVA